VKIKIAGFGGYELNTLAMARGEHHIEHVEEGEVVALIVLVGCLQVTRERSGQPANFCLHASRTKPLLLVNPGRYTVVAEANILGVRGARKGGVL
jgi:hypothetical protein